MATGRAGWVTSVPDRFYSDSESKERAFKVPLAQASCTLAAPPAPIPAVDLASCAAFESVAQTENLRSSGSQIASENARATKRDPVAPTRVIFGPEVAEAVLMATALRSIRTFYHRVRSWQAGLSTAERLVLFATAVYGIVMSALTVAKISTLGTFAWDLGTYSQALYTTAFQGRFFYFTADLPNNPTGSMFGAHFTPFLFIFVPIYRLLPSPATLLVIQTLAIAAGAPIVFRLARLRLKDERLAAVLAGMYLLNPFVEGVNWFDVHPEAYMMVFLLAAILAWEGRAWLWFWIFIGLTLSTLEMAGVVVATVGLFWALDLLIGRRSLRSALGALEFRLGLGLVALGVLWFYIGLRAISIVNPGNALLGTGTGFWQVLGAKSLLDVPFAIISNPGRLIAAFSYDWARKLWYLVLLFAPFLFWPLRRPLALLLVAPWLLVALTSELQAYYVVGTQYGAFVAPMLVYGAILGLERHRARRAEHPVAQGTSGSPAAGSWRSLSRPLPIVAYALAFAIVFGPAGPFAVGVYSSGGFPVFTAHDALVQEIAALVPASASILTQNNLFPLFANRADAFVIPSTTFFASGNSFNQTLRTYFNESDFVYVDGTTSLIEALVVLQALQTTPGIGVVASADGAILLKRNYTAPPKLFVPLDTTYDASSLALVNGTMSADPLALGGVAMTSAPGQRGSFWTGPGVILWPGNYTVTFRVRLDPVVSGPVLDLAYRLRPGFISVLPVPVSAQETGAQLAAGLLHCTSNLTVVNVTGSEFSNPSTYTTLTESFEVRFFGAYDFAGFLPGTNAVVSLDSIHILQATALPYVETAACPP